MAIPEDEWRVSAGMRPAEMVATLRELAQQGCLKGYRKSPRGPKNPGRNARGPPKHPMSPLRNCSGSNKSVRRHLNRAGWRSLDGDGGARDYYPARGRWEYHHLEAAIGPRRCHTPPFVKLLCTELHCGEVVEGWPPPLCIGERVSPVPPRYSVTGRWGLDPGASEPHGAASLRSLSLRL